MVTLHEVITFLVSMQISISSLQTHNVNRCGRSRHLARKLSLRRKRSSPNVFEMAATETITSIILIKLIRVSLGTVRLSQLYVFMPPNLGGFFMVRSYYPSECHADYFDFERIEALKPAIEA